MSFEFKEYELVKVQEIECPRKVFDVQEEISVDAGDNEFHSITLSCGNPEDDSWRSLFIEFAEEADYEAFCGLLREAADIDLR